MSDSNETKKAKSYKPSAALAAALDEYRDILDQSGGNIGDRWVLMALGSDDVLEAFDKHLKNDEVFAHVSVQGGAEDRVSLVFEFRSAPPKVCLVPKRFSAVVNPMTGQTDSVVDPYMVDAGQVDGTPKPGNPDASSHPAVGASHPAVGASHPALGASHPALGASHPAVGASHPALGASHPALGASHPAVGISHPAIGASHPAL